MALTNSTPSDTVVDMREVSELPKKRWGFLSSSCYALSFGVCFAKEIITAAVPRGNDLDADAEMGQQHRNGQSTFFSQTDAAHAHSQKASNAAETVITFAPTASGNNGRSWSVNLWRKFQEFRDWIRRRRQEMKAARQLAREQQSSYGWRQYIYVTAAYWALTLTDGAIRMLVLFYFLGLGYSALEVASLFLFYEVFGVITNLVGGWVGAKFGLRITLLGGLATQVLALVMMALVSPGWAALFAVPYVMTAQAFSGIAKDLTKMSSKSSIKLVLPENTESSLFKWVSVLTGSKNALKGLGFFLGALLLMTVGYNLAMILMALGLMVTIFLTKQGLPHEIGKAKKTVKFSGMFSMSRRINILSAARFFLFGARDVWFVVALPIYLAAILGLSAMGAAGYIALWVIGYGIIQSLAPRFLRSLQPVENSAPKSYTAQFWTYLLATVPAGIALGLSTGLLPGLVLMGGLAVFGVIFAITSAVHSYLIVSYSAHDQVTMNVGFYYMANAGGRLIGTILSGLLFHFLGIIGCLWISSMFLVTAGGITTLLSIPDRQQDEIDSAIALASANGTLRPA